MLVAVDAVLDTSKGGLLVAVDPVLDPVNANAPVDGVFVVSPVNGFVAGGRLFSVNPLLDNSRMDGAFVAFVVCPVDEAPIVSEGLTAVNEPVVGLVDPGFNVPGA